MKPPCHRLPRRVRDATTHSLLDRAELRLTHWLISTTGREREAARAEVRRKQCLRGRRMPPTSRERFRLDAEKAERLFGTSQDVLELSPEDVLVMMRMAPRVRRQDSRRWRGSSCCTTPRA